MKKISVLGSTGSIGTQCLEIVEKYGFEIEALTANKNIKLLEKQARVFNPKFVAVYDEQKAKELKIALNDTNVKVYGGESGEDKKSTYEKVQEFAKQVLDHMRERLSDYQEMYGDLYNLEATPAESTTYRFAKHDKKHYPDIITANENGTPYYTNSSHLPVGYTEDIFTALEIQDELQTRYTSGTVFHAFLGEKLPDWQSAAALVRKIAENHKLPYYTMSPTYSVCADHGYITGEEYTCPICGKKTEVYSRITGYYRPVQNWNDGKSQEYKDRKVYDIENSHLNKTQRVQLKAEEPVCEVKVASNAKALLFSRVTCPICASIRA